MARTAASQTLQIASLFPRIGAFSIATLGDSITAINSGAGTAATPVAAPSLRESQGYMTWCNMRLAHRLDYVYNGGVGGNTTDQILARVGSITGLSPKPGFCVVQGGTNDMGGSNTNAQIVNNLTATANILLSAGIVPILVAVVPSGTQQSRRGPINRMLSDYVRANPNMLYCDWHSAISDPTTGSYYTGMSADTVHPNQSGASWMGNALANVLAPVIAQCELLTSDNTDAENLIANGMMTGTTGTLSGGGSGTVPTGWTAAWGANATYSQVARTDGKQGTWTQIALATPGASSPDYMYVTCPVTAGSVYVAEAEFQIDVAGVTGFTDLSLVMGNSGAVIRAADNLASGLVKVGAGNYQIPSAGVLRSLPTTMPASENINLTLQFGATTGTVRFARASFKKVA